MADFKTIRSERLKETVLFLHHPSGLDIYIAPKPGYSSQYAIFGTRYGSIDNRFAVNGETVAVPEGIAHYLEHKLFESEDGDAFSRYAETGASANAYTSFDRTCYLFSSTSRFKDSLEILLDFVQKPYFTAQTVQKEQGIIGQEIRMYDDSPDWRVLFNLLGALYHKHPVKIDVAGTVESISHITAELLYRCYNAFYNLNNMVLCVAGDVNPDDVLDVADRLLSPAAPTGAQGLFEPESETIVRPRVTQALAVASPVFAFGFKDTPAEGRAYAEHEALTSILLEMLCGDASPLYRRLYDEGLINQNFSSQFFSGRSFAATIVSGESRDPDAVQAAFLAEAARLAREGLDVHEFETAKRAIYGRLAAGYDSVETIANALASCRFLDIGPFDLIDAVAQADIGRAQERLNTHFAPERCALSVITPAEH